MLDINNNPIPFRDYKALEKRLEKGSLYDFFGIEKDISTDELNAKILEKFTEYSKITSLKDRQYACEICSYAIKILGTPEARKNYDNYILLKEIVWDELENRYKLGTYNIQKGELDMYVQKICVTLKCTTVEAEKIFAVGCKYYRLNIL